MGYWYWVKLEILSNKIWEKLEEENVRFGSWSKSYGEYGLDLNINFVIFGKHLLE